MFYNMAAGTDFPPHFNLIEGPYNKDSNPAVKDNPLEDLNDLKQTSKGKPPRHLSIVRHSINSAILLSPSNLDVDLTVVGHHSPSDEKSTFLPIFRSGCCAETGPKQYMEDEHICIDNLLEHLGENADLPSPGAFYGVFDGHGGIDAAVFVRKNILKFIIEDSYFPLCLEKAIRNAFLKADHAFADDSTLDISSGTTVLTTMIFGRTLVVANAGDCRAVLGKRGKAVELSKDHKPNCTSERLRIEKLGGAVFDGYLNGQLSVARALGD